MPAGKLKSGAVTRVIAQPRYHQTADKSTATARNTVDTAARHFARPHGTLVVATVANRENELSTNREVLLKSRVFRNTC